MKAGGDISSGMSKVTRCTQDRVLPLSLFVSVTADYMVTFPLAALVSPFLIIMQDWVEILADTLLLRGQLRE